jgi:antitoxin HigA-1
MTVPFPGDVIQDRINDVDMSQFEVGTRNPTLHWVTINRLIKGHEKITPQVALILAKMFSATPQYWMHLQADWDLYEHQQNLAQPKKKLHEKQADIIARTKVFA